MDTTQEYIKTPEHRRKLSIAMRGNKNQKSKHSPETKAKIADSMRRRLIWCAFAIPAIVKQTTIGITGG